MDQRRAVEDDRDGGELPEQRVVVDALGQRIERDVAERVVEEMADQVAEQHQAADQPHLSHADTTEERPDRCGGR
jgi:hypothetical protein